ncbi:thiamine phosphate synthase [Candidatus Magnetomonas plexicatena]|uniref:thiamine phosphate synthase n=1 Tax=Candidatus Magnetomonas plexicatena TaxID=2552947 RepID=UPI001C75CD38|nr:thiamine phosphate synthase [Nitrospirales bacterium LBB_01]
MKSYRGLYQSGLCLIMDRGDRIKPAFDSAVSAIGSGVTWIQLRDKTSDRLQIFKTGRILRALTSANNVKLIINDYPDIALAVDADGVHIGQDDMSLKYVRKIFTKKRHKVIGVSTHSVEEAVRAEEEGADYIGFGPIFRTTTKDAGAPKGVEALSEVLSRVSIPVVAIGGIALENVKHVLEAGAHAVAVASGIMESDDIGTAAAEFVDAISKKTKAG